ncbi:1294_t:CDS:2 [Paraglomus occultum]|uniref:1294_t:CDS:1 n=1 Tax=Paraglomus occultum TaxID=144539 RepID=A0A9N8ZL25_9GLOM|nr:1294_t:CDS:2 [Paraglomus occultum]
MSLSLTDRLVELSKARNNGLITEEEYAAMRARLLDSFATVTIPPRTASMPQESDIRQSRTSPVPPSRPLPPPPTTNYAPNRCSDDLLLNGAVDLATTLYARQGSKSELNLRSLSRDLPVAGRPGTSFRQSASDRQQRAHTLILPRDLWARLRDTIMTERPGSVVVTANNSLSICNGYDESVPETPPPPYSPPEPLPRRRRASTSFFVKQKTATELREELSKLVDDAKREQDSWKMEEARLKMKMGTKPEEIERVRRKQRASAEKYTRKIEAINIKLSIALAIEQV